MPEIAIFSTIKRQERPASSEGFDALYFVRLQADGNFDVQPWRDEEPAE